MDNVPNGRKIRGKKAILRLLLRIQVRGDENLREGDEKFKRKKGGHQGTFQR